jgi:hypothetical protein
MAALSLPQMNDEPLYFSLVTDADRRAYHELKSSFARLNSRRSRSHQATAFAEIVSKIRQYAIRGDSDDPKRSLVCGLVWLSDSMAFNTRQLCKLVGKCKSSINSGLQAIGSGPITMTPGHVRQLIELFPFMRGLGGEMRQWTIRGIAAPNIAIPASVPAANEDVDECGVPLTDSQPSDVLLSRFNFYPEDSDDFFETPAYD